MSSTAPLATARFGAALNEFADKAVRTSFGQGMFRSVCLWAFCCVSLLLAGNIRGFSASLQIQIDPQFAGEAVQPGSLRYQTVAGESFSISRVSYLLSGFALERGDGSWLELTKQQAWLDLDVGRN